MVLHGIRDAFGLALSGYVGVFDFLGDGMAGMIGRGCIGRGQVGDTDRDWISERLSTLDDIGSAYLYR